MKEFDKIIGYEPVKKELKRICDILVNPEKYKKFGVKASQGLLIYGEPGVGKSLMADCFMKATKRKKFICRKTNSNGDFIKDIFNTFKKAQENAPSIILLDDLDKFANDDYDHKDSAEFVTVQACIDAVKDDNVFVVATANDIKKLPDSLLRSGRFSKRIEIEIPFGKDAENIIKYYLGKKKNVGNIDLNEITRLLNGRTCADLEAVVNEAGIYAVSENKDKIDQNDMIRACMRVMYDAPEADEVLKSNSSEKNLMTAYHEAGHALVSEYFEPESVTLVSIASYDGGTEGITSCYQDRNYFSSIKYLKTRAKALLAGKAAIELKFGEIDIGASSDIEKAFQVVKRFVDDYCGFGFDAINRRPYADQAVNNCSSRIASVLQNYYMEVKEILAKNREFLDKLANELLKKTTLLTKDIQRVKSSCNIVYNINMV